MDTIILAGGLGSRLRSVVADVPKCLAPVCGKPFLHYVLLYLQQQGIRRIILSLGYLHEVVEKWLEQEKYNIEFEFSIEKTPLGTGGGIKSALSHVSSENVLILNGDTFYGVDIAMFKASHISNGAVLSMALKPMEKFDRYGNVILDTNGYIIKFQEKEYCQQGLINGGCYIMQTKCDWLNHQPEKFSFETNVLEYRALKKEIYGFVDNGYFIDIGIPSDYEKANKEFFNLL